MFHPITNFYTHVYEVDGERYTTGLPNPVVPNSIITMDFNWAKVYYPSKNNMHGKFEFDP